MPSNLEEGLAAATKPVKPAIELIRLYHMLVNCTNQLSQGNRISGHQARENFKQVSLAPPGFEPLGFDHALGRLIQT